MTKGLFRFEIDIRGVKKIKNVFARLKRFLNNTTSAMQNIGAHLLKVYRLNFTSEGSKLGKPWKQLAPATVLDRARQGFGAAHPILHRDGRLKRGFKAIVGKDIVKVENVVPYFRFHQLSGGRIPRRIMLFFNTRLSKEVLQMFTKMLVKSLHGNL